MNEIEILHVHRSFNMVKIAVIPESIYILNIITIKIPAAISVQID